MASDAPKLIEAETGLYGKDEVFQVANIYYNFDKADIRPDAATELNKLIPIMKQNPAMKIEIRSHTDSRASDDYNLKLSDKRAKMVVKYLVSRGISAKRLIATGYGETQLLNECANGEKCAEEQHQQNRRTEFKVISVQ